jgi:hypothetical protein
MPTLKSSSNFIDSVTGQQVARELRDMTVNGSYHTESSYSADGLQFPDHRMSFVDKHLRYLSTHPTLDPSKYIANLKLMTRVR